MTGLITRILVKSSQISLMDNHYACLPILFSTLKEAPAEAELPSHKLMMRAGMIRRVASGLYNWMPIGFRVLKKSKPLCAKK